ncbi:MAG TPA: glycosyltransferase [Thermodesulfobacteriota bacterium]
MSRGRVGDVREAPPGTPSTLEWAVFAQRTCVVTVTYGDRAHLVRKAVAAAFDAGAGGIVVVDNGAAPPSRAEIDRLAQAWGGRLEVVRLPENRGSAGGFRAGLERVRDRAECEFIWLLDDDNAPRPDALGRLWHAYGALGADPNHALLSLRPDRKEYLLAATCGVPVAITPNAFLGFHLMDVPSKVRRRLSPARPGRAAIRFPLAAVGYAPYGGFFFHRSWLDRVGLPDERLYLYGDDHDFSLRFVRAGGTIYLCAASEVVDLEPSWHHEPSASRPWVSPAADERRVYYAVRNRARLEKAFTTSRIAYWANACTYLGFLVVVGLLGEGRARQVLRRVHLVLRALRDGRSDHRGRAADEGPAV